MIRRKKLIWILGILAIIMLGLISFRFYVRMKYVTRDFNHLDLSNVDSVMIVAHPDDELIWGGSHLLQGRYLVVCITAGNDMVRAEEFKKVMKETDDVGIMLGYPDKVFFQRSNWTGVYDDIQNDIQKILSLKKWKEIITHNPQGEYGHIHHIMTNKIVTEVYKNDFSDEDNLYYFGKYYDKKQIKEASKQLTPVDDKSYKTKCDIMKRDYLSQAFVREKFLHMFKYEDFQKYQPT